MSYAQPVEPFYSLFNVLQGDIAIVLYENVLYVKVMCYFNEQVDFKLSSKLIHMIYACLGVNHVVIFVGTFLNK